MFRTGPERQTLRAFWYCATVSGALGALTALTFWRPDWLQTGICAAFAVSLCITAIGFQEAWKVWRGLT